MWCEWGYHRLPTGVAFLAFETWSLSAEAVLGDVERAVSGDHRGSALNIGPRRLRVRGDRRLYWTRDPEVKVNSWGSPRSRIQVLPVLCAVLCVGYGCGKSGPTSPSSPTANGLSGRWTGIGSDSSGAGTLTLVLQQQGDSVTGTVSAGGSQGTSGGTFQGTVNGSTLAFTIGLAAPTNGGCATSVSGNGTISTTQIQGTYAGSSTCFGTINDGTLSLERR